MKIISLWSGPRNVSTAFMYSFAERPDTEVIDEPFYAHYLARSGADHPGKEEVLKLMENDGQQVIHSLLTRKSSKPLLFVKNMAHHFIDLPFEELAHFDNIFLVRDPKEMLPSLAKQIPNPIIRDTGLDKQVEIYKYLVSQGQQPLIIDSQQLLENPEEMLKAVCHHLDIPFYQNMLQWEAGPRKEDGCWAKFWYHNVHKSTGFKSYQPKNEPFPDRLKALLTDCNAYYQFLQEKALTTNQL